MEQKINIAEILDGCHKGTKLYSPIFGNVYLEKIRPHLAVVVTTESNDKEEFLYDGRYGINGECVLFPSKDQRDWSKFQRPFKEGDILYIDCNDDGDTDKRYQYIFILKEINEGNVYSYCYIDEADINKRFEIRWLSNPPYIPRLRLATETEKEKLFKVIKDNGYKWNPETKTLEKLVEPRFEVGNIIEAENPFYNYKVIKITDTHYTLETIPGAIIHNVRICEDKYWKLVPNKFDINNLKPFESKVLVRDFDNGIWEGAIFGRYDGKKFFTIGGLDWECCIPYKGNEHLHGTTNDCDDFYKNW